MSQPTIALIIDCSGSMTEYRYLDFAKTDACTFVNIMHPQDGCAVIAFSDDASVVKPLTALTGQAAKNDVCAAIEGIRAINLTNIKAGIVAANGQIGSAPDPKGMVLLSDGMWNVGGDPLAALPAIRIYTIALGSHGQLQLMQQIAGRTGGKYNFAPGFRELAQVYNDIAAEAGVADVVTNTLDSVGAYGYKEVAAPIAAGAGNGTFTVNWDDESVTYTPGTPTGNQVNITLYDPSGRKVTVEPAYVRPAVVVFQVPDPQPGEWKVGCWYAGRNGGPSLDCTWGGFEPPGTARLALRTGTVPVRPGQTVRIEAEFHDGEAPVEAASVRAVVDAPGADREEVLRGHANELAALLPDRSTLEMDVPDDLARIIALEKRLGRALVPRARRPVFDVVATGDGRHTLEVRDTAVKGSYTVHVTARGYSPRLKTAVQRTRLLSFHVE